jgi:hypothetical protein
VDQIKFNFRSMASDIRRNRTDAVLEIGLGVCATDIALYRRSRECDFNIFRNELVKENSKFDKVMPGIPIDVLPEISRRVSGTSVWKQRLNQNPAWDGMVSVVNLKVGLYPELVKLVIVIVCAAQTQIFS